MWPSQESRIRKRIISLRFLGIILRVLGLEVSLKVPKRENFLFAFFALSEPIWVCDLGAGEKNRIFNQLTPDLDSFWFFAAY